MDDIQWHAQIGCREEFEEWVREYDRWNEIYSKSLYKEPDMKAGDMIESKYLKQSDIDGEVIATIQKVGRGNVAMDDQPEEMKWMIRFTEFKKPMVLNSTNIQLLEKICGEETDDWPGQEVILYVDPNVSFGGKLTGGIRLKSAKPAAAPRRVASKTVEDMADDVPFR